MLHRSAPLSEISSPRLRPDEAPRPKGEAAAPSRSGALSTRDLLRVLSRDFVLPIRIPALGLLAYTLYNTYLYNQALQAFDRGSRFATTRGKLLSIEKNNYFYNAVPRYAVHYEFVVDGVRYESRRATTGSFYRDWMIPLQYLFRDTITESQYLQAFPVLRQGEACTVFYDSKAPGRHSALASDANSAEGGVALYLAVFPLIFGNMLMTSWRGFMRRMRPPKMRVRIPKYDQEHAEALGHEIKRK